jgi:hypothetical protein
MRILATFRPVRRRDLIMEGAKHLKRTARSSPSGRKWVTRAGRNGGFHSGLGSSWLAAPGLNIG